MKKKRWLASILAAAMLTTTAVGLVGCGDSNSNSQGNSASDKKDSKQELNIIYFDPQTLDTNNCSDTDSATIIGAVQEGLLRIQNTGGQDKLVDAGAEKHEVSTDGLTYTFKLRDYKWSDGKPVTAQQFKDSIIRILDQKKAFPYAFFAYNIVNGQAYNQGKAKAEDVGVTAKDDKTLEIKLAKADPTFLSKIAYQCFMPVRLDVIEKGGENYETDITKQVYCGPYKISEWNKNNSIKLVKNPDYWDAKNVFIETVNSTNIKEFSTQAQMFEAKQLDVTGSTTEYLDKWTKEAEQGKFKAIKAGDPSTDYLSFNLKNAPSGILSNVKVRKAFAMSINRENYLKDVFGRYTPAYGVVPTTLSLGDKEYRSIVPEPLKDEVSKYAGKPQEIQKLLHEGLKELGKDKDNLKDIHLTYLVYGATSLQKQSAEWWQQELQKNLGVTIDLKVYGESKLYYNDLKAYKYDLTLQGWHGDYNDPMTFIDLFSNPDMQPYTGGYSNEDYNKIVDSLAGVTDQAKRKDIFATAEKKLITEDYGVVPVDYRDKRTFMQNYVKDFEMPMFGSLYEWRWAYISGKE
ncbi:peptide ABC transporter substrate-binding protein [Inconstantimicrobium mannanitabidum]|uniref:Peptide ABC transporter substrate-binding protein n=1 Tax=Inconstantimicrobium mannanitabidum TaxID=1604901 RepID=A0ACB5RDA6_9CLOT|nr:peptide ABC transporter substrate-binding protein [Clostridium sp. TW13]GKX67086.1 peptide ABC transporter substrate-binding protein [Clostridium sp. TW13]